MNVVVTVIVVFELIVLVMLCVGDCGSSGCSGDCSCRTGRSDLGEMLYCSYGGGPFPKLLFCG